MSQAEPFREKSLFGTESDSYFGDKKAFCAYVVSKLKLTAENETDPEAILRRHSKESVFSQAFEREVSLEELLPTPNAISEEDATSLLKKPECSGIQAFGSDGSIPPAAAVATTMLVIRAFDELCAPIKEWSPAKTQFMRDMKAKLDGILSGIS